MGLKSMFKFCYSDRKVQIFQLDKVRFADVASSYIEKMQRSIAEKDELCRSNNNFKHALYL